MMLRSPETPRLTAVLDEVVDALRAYEPEQIILYGSVARGDAGEFSDIDLIVVKETDVPRRERMIECRAHVPSMLGVDVDIFVYTPAEIERSLEARNPFIAAAFTDGVVVYDRHPSAGTRSLRFRVKEPTMESRLAHGQEWLTRAERDLHVALTLSNDLETPASCFHSQQAAEKAFKGFLIFQGLPLERVHSVKDLAAACAREDEEFLTCADAAQALDSLYIDTRYPDPETHVFKGYQPEEARGMLDHAVKIVSLVRSRIPPLDSSAAVTE